MKKTTFITLSLSLLVALPAMAQLTIGQLGQVSAEFQYYSVDLQNYLRYNLSETLKPLEASSQNSLNNATGDLNIPNPIAAGKQVSDELVIYSISDKFENNPAVRGKSVSNEINRLITRASVEGIMGKNGQTRLKAKLADTETSLENIAASVKESDDIFSEFLTKIPGLSEANKVSGMIGANQSSLQLQSIKIQQEQSKILAETFAQTTRANQSLQYSNLNRARRVDTSAEAARLLRTTSQIDLFGRKEN
jgi:hypothetical protein